MNAAHSPFFSVQSAVSLRPAVTHVLRVVNGRAWVTLVGQMEQDNPDLFLNKGDVLHIQAGQHVVVESWAREPGEPLLVQWQIAYDDSVEPSHDQGIACPPAPKLLPVKAT